MTPISTRYSKIAVYICLLYLPALLFTACQQATSASLPTDTDPILPDYGQHTNKFREVLKYYEDLHDTLKWNSAIYLMKNIKDKFFYEPEQLPAYKNVLQQSQRMQDPKKFINNGFDSLNRLYKNAAPRKVYDYEYVTKDYLIDNIEYAFKAWQLPWARHLSFDEFCEYILPYKVTDEKPGPWRKDLFEQFCHIGDSVGENDVQKITSAINTKINWFRFQWPFKYPVTLDYTTMGLGKAGSCFDATNLTVYALRAVGIPATVDYTPQWASRNYGHSWNTVKVSANTFIPFQGTETNPGLTKLEYDPNEDYTFKRAKIYRFCFARQAYNDEVLKEEKNDLPELFKNVFYKDVTRDFIPTADISIKANKKIQSERKTNTTLCVFDNLNWVPVDHGIIDGNTLQFRNIGTDIVCIAAAYNNHKLHYQSDPFLISRDGTVHYLTPDTLHRETATLYKKYPYNLSNEIKPGDRYQLFYWNNDTWVLVSEQTAAQKLLQVNNIPANALLLLRDISRGKQERPFIIRNNKQIFY